MFSLAVRLDALPISPVRETATIRKVAKVRDSLTLEQVWDLRAKVAANPRAHELDVVDIIDFELATGTRIGETLAVAQPALDLTNGRVEIKGTVIRVTGQGLFIKPPKTATSIRWLYLPGWEVTNLERAPEDPAG